MKKMFLFSLVIATLVILGCSKENNLPPYTPPVKVNFAVTSLNHTRDTVSIGDTVYLTATGTMADTSSAFSKIYAYVTTTYTTGGVSNVNNFGSSTSPFTLSYTVQPKNSDGLYVWTATITLPATATLVPSGTKLAISANFAYQLSLSTEQGNLSAADAGILTKTVFVQ